MKKFNSSQPPLINPNEVNNSMAEEYQPTPNITQNLRLLKTKMRLNSASSQDAETYSNISQTNVVKGKTNNENMFRNSSNSLLPSAYEDNNHLLINKTNSAYSSSTRKQKPVKADHQVLNPSKRFIQNKTKTQDSGESDVSTPMKKLTKANSNPYETSSGNKFMKSTQKSNAGEEDTKYLSSQEIEKLSNPKASMTQIITDLASKDWEVQVNA